MPNLDPLGLLVSEKKIFEYLVLGCHGNQTSAWNHILFGILIGDHARIINMYVKFGENRTSGFRKKLTTNHRQKYVNQF